MNGRRDDMTLSVLTKRLEASAQRKHAFFAAASVQQCEGFTFSVLAMPLFPFRM